MNTTYLQAMERRRLLYCEVAPDGESREYVKKKCSTP